jgi:hypothetical protein
LGWAEAKLAKRACSSWRASALSKAGILGRLIDFLTGDKNRIESECWSCSSKKGNKITIKGNFCVFSVRVTLVSRKKNSGRDKNKDKKREIISFYGIISFLFGITQPNGSFY